MQVLHVVLDAHEVVPHAQYDDDDIGYAVPGGAELCSRQTSQQQQAASSCFVREGESAAEREFVLVLYGYNLLRLVKLILRDTRKSIISNRITNTIESIAECQSDKRSFEQSQ